MNVALPRSKQPSCDHSQLASSDNLARDASETTEPTMTYNSYITFTLGASRKAKSRGHIRSPSRARVFSASCSTRLTEPGRTRSEDDRAKRPARFSEVSRKRGSIVERGSHRARVVSPGGRRAGDAAGLVEGDASFRRGLTAHKETTYDAHERIEHPMMRYRVSRGSRYRGGGTTSRGRYVQLTDRSTLADSNGS